MHTIYLLRHAKSSWADPSLPDRERPLAPRGRRDAKRIASHLREGRVEPELVLCSSAARASQTLELVRRALGAATVRLEDGLYAASAEELLERLRTVPEDVASVLLIGHNPGLQDVALASRRAAPSSGGSRRSFRRLRSRPSSCRARPGGASARATPSLLHWSCRSSSPEARIRIQDVARSRRRYDAGSATGK